MRWPESEVALGRAFIPHLKRHGMLVFPEVPLPAAADEHGETPIPDLIAISHRERVCEIYELKLRSGVDLVADAGRWTAACHRAWGVAPAPSPDRRRSRAFVEACLAFKRSGAGLALVHETGSIERVVTARFNPRPVDIGIEEALLHARQGYAEAGSPGRARRYSPRVSEHAHLRDALVELLERRPKISAARAFRMIGAGVPFILAARSGRIAGIRVERGRLFAVADADADLTNPHPQEDAMLT